MRLEEDPADHLQRGEITALYASAGADTLPISFLTRAFLDARGAAAVPEPTKLIYVDRGGPMEPDDPSAPLTFDDANTRIRTTSVRIDQFLGLPALLLRVEHESAHGNRAVVVVRVHASNEELAPAARAAGWVPDLFIGVTDGCSFGGNKHCVNRLTTWGLPPEVTKQIPLPRWWVTDHFRAAQIPGQLRVGDLVTSEDDGFPAVFRKVALLSTQWGTYGHGAIGGATVFAVEQRERKKR